MKKQSRLQALLSKPSVKPAEHRETLPITLKNLRMPLMIRGSVDVVTPTEVRGWAYAPDSREPVRVQVLLNQEILGETIANIHRSDLAAAGLGNGNSGFAIQLFRQIDPLYLPFLVVKMNGGDAELPRAPTLGFKDFFNSLYVTHPTAGRQRSVFGGLWTDRTDAAALLRGKMEIGQLSTETARTVEKLIYSGLSIVRLQSTPEQSGWANSSSDQVGELLEEPSLLLPLRAILEDNPLVVETAVVEHSTARLTQPSAAAPSTSPAECVEVIVALGEGVVLEVVRESHRLPEFSTSGRSRWTSGLADDVLDVVAVNGLLDREELAHGTAAIVGPGTIYRLRCEAGAAAARILCLPARGLPVALAIAEERTDTLHDSGIRVLA